MVVVDLLGFGRSDPAQGAQARIQAHADRVVAVLDELGIERACIAGHELGGGVAQAVALGSPSRVSGLCLIDSVAFGNWPIRALRIARRLLPLTRLVSQSVLRSFVRSEFIRGFADRDAGSHDLDLFLRPFENADGHASLIAHIAALEPSLTHGMGARLDEIRVPTAVVWGAHDPFLHRSVGERLAAAIPGSTMTVVPEARHFVPRDAPHAVARAVGSLLE